MMMIFAKIVGYAAWFWFGRCSANWIRNKKLEQKRNELETIAAELLAWSKELAKKDQAIRQKWQMMVDDFSKYDAYANKRDPKTWTEWDDIYLESWKSAER